MTVGDRIDDSGRARPRHGSLDDWLKWQESLHVREIDLSLDRVQEVAVELGLRQPSYPVITVAGTNGKGSTVSMLEAIIHAAGYRVGCYTSPHLLRYNERVRIAREEVDDDALCAAFARVDAARGGIPLTYFEFGTLAALDIFSRSRLDVGVLEVGMGGRLDAVNIIDTDVAVIATIDIDHVEWLGPDRESIGREKAGIMRSGRPALCSDPRPPASLVRHAAQVQAELLLIDRDFGYEAQPDGFNWWSRNRRFEQLPRPSLVGEFQLQNAAGVLMALELMAPRLPMAEADLARGLRSVRLPGRFQVFPGPVEHVLDVAHNAESGRILAETLRGNPVAGCTHAVIGMLRDKDQRSVVGAIAPLVDRWYAVGLVAPRGTTAEQMLAQVAQVSSLPGESHVDVAAALAAAQARALPGDRILVTGSFLTVAGALRVLQSGR